MQSQEREERGNFIQRGISNLFVFCKPSLDKKNFKKIMYDFSDELIFIKKKRRS